MQCNNCQAGCLQGQNGPSKNAQKPQQALAKGQDPKSKRPVNSKGDKPAGITLGNFMTGSGGHPSDFPVGNDAAKDVSLCSDPE